jgi:phage-related protein
LHRTRDIEFYRTKDRKCPVEDFLGTLGPKETQKVLWVFRLIGKIDRVPANYFKKLIGTTNIWECRILTVKGTYRFFGFFIQGNKLILTHGYSKKTQKTDLREIRRAETHRQDYLNRHKERES